LSSCSSLIYTVLFSSSSALLFSKSCSYFMAFSIASEPCRSFSSMFLILLSSFCCLLFSLLAASSLDLSSSKNFYFSSSAISTCCWIFLRSFSNYFLIFSFSCSSESSIYFMRSLFSTCTNFSTSMIYWPSDPTCTPLRLYFPPENYSSSALSLDISSWNSLIIVSLGSSLIFGLFWMFFALDAYLSEDRVSSML